MKSPGTRLRKLGGAIGGAVLLALTALAPEASAAPRPQIVEDRDLSLLRTDVWVDSPSMKERVKVSVLTPPYEAGPRSTVYLLDGADAGENVSDWITKGRAGRFFADKNINVVLPAGGAGSFYTDWIEEDPELGKPQWETFLTEELPPLIDARFNGTGRNAIVGLSMGGQAAYALTARNPELYSGAASLSGCPPVSGPLNEGYVRSTVANAGGNADNMWGRIGSPAWQAHDPALLLDRLRGKNLFLSAGTGAIGPLDMTVPIDPSEGPREQVNAAGSALEIGAYRCSLQFATQLRAAGIAVTDNFRLIGTHKWIYWERDLPAAWRAISRGL